MFKNDIWVEQPSSAVKLFSALCECWKKNTKTISVVVEGAGDVFKGKYWEKLKEISDERLKSKIWITDIMDIDPEILQDIEMNPNISFIDKRKEEDQKLYRSISSDLTLILVPDMYHTKVAGCWTEASGWRGRASAIFLEKPYDSSYDRAYMFYNEFRLHKDESSTVIICFDHYLAKINSFFMSKDILLNIIGKINRISFALLEKDQIKKERLDTLKLGISFDLLPHPFAIISSLLNFDSFKPSEKPYAGKYQGLPKDYKETYIKIKGSLDDDGHIIRVEGSVGKGIGKDDIKWLMLEGEEGHVIFDFSEKNPEIRIMYPESIKEKHWCSLTDGYRPFLTTLFSGGYIDNPIGAITHNNSLIILRKIHDISNEIRLNKLKEYEIGTEEKNLFPLKNKEI